MASTWGAKRGMPEYDKFRTGLTYDDIYRQFLWSYDDDPKTWRHKSRGIVLGFWHKLKRDMWEQYQHAKERKRISAARIRGVFVEKRRISRRGSRRAASAGDEQPRHRRAS